MQRINIAEIRNDEWFKKNYTPVKLLEYEEVNLDDLNAVFYDCEVGKAFKSCILFPSILSAFCSRRITTASIGFYYLVFVGIGKVCCQ